MPKEPYHAAVYQTKKRVYVLMDKKELRLAAPLSDRLQKISPPKKDNHGAGPSSTARKRCAERGKENAK